MPALMQTSPRRLAPTRSAALPRGPGIPIGWPAGVPAGGRIFPPLRAAWRTLLLLLWTVAAIPPQLLFLRLPGRAKVSFARVFWAVATRLLGVKTRVLGELAAGPVVFVCNHSSWLDIPVLGGCLPAVFVSKEEIRGWPLINIVAALGRTVYVRRTRGSTGRERDRLRARLAAGDSLILFPEGTTGDGSRVLPFRSSLLAVAEGAAPPMIQPVSVVFDRLGGLPVLRPARPLFAYYGDMTLGPHYWDLAQFRGIRATVLLHPAVDPLGYPDRKALSRALWEIVAEGAGALRQNRK